MHALGAVQRDFGRDKDGQFHWAGGMKERYNEVIGLYRKHIGTSEQKLAKKMLAWTTDDALDFSGTPQADRNSRW